MTIDADFDYDASSLTARANLDLVGAGETVRLDDRVVRISPKVNENDAECAGRLLIEFDQALSRTPVVTGMLDSLPHAYRPPACVRRLPPGPTYQRLDRRARGAFPTSRRTTEPRRKRKMPRQDVLKTIATCIQELLPSVTDDQINAQVSLKDLGANSVDRADILLAVTEALAVDMSLSELTGAKTIGELRELFENKVSMLAYRASKG